VAEEKNDDSSSGLDFEIEALLDSPEETDTAGQGIRSTIQKEPNSEEENSEQNTENLPESEAVEDIEEATTWVELLDAIGQEPPMFIQIWGRFWGQMEDVAAAFYLLLDPGENELENRRFVAFGNPSPLSEFHPRMDGKDFEQRLLESGVRNEAVPQVIYQLVEEAIEEYFEQEQAYETVAQIVEEDDLDQFRDWSDQFVRRIIEGGEFELQFRAQQISKSELNEIEGDTASEGEPDSKQKDDQAPSTDDVLDVSILTSPRAGISVAELSEADNVFVRIIDDRAKHLPENLLDPDRSPPASIPLRATVQNVKIPDTLPERIEEGEPEDYREIVVDLEQTVPGKGLVYIEDRIKTEQLEKVPDERELETLPFLLVLAVLLLVVLIIVF